jgi:GGDEF domain-containing protein
VASDPDLGVVEKRERHLRFATLLLLLLLAATTVLSLALVGDSVGLGGAERSLRFGALGVFFVLTVLFCLYAFRAHANSARIRRLYQEKALRDPLTGLLNRQSLGDRFGTEASRVQRSGSSFPVLLCDLDNFKLVNDSHGHPFGDGILVEVAQALLDSTRGSDFIFRWEATSSSYFSATRLARGP